MVSLLNVDRSAEEQLMDIKEGDIGARDGPGKSDR